MLQGSHLRSAMSGHRFVAASTKIIGSWWLFCDSLMALNSLPHKLCLQLVEIPSRIVDYILAHM